MAICIKCGNNDESCLCTNCKSIINIEQLCNEVITYRPGSGENPIWESICNRMSNPNNFSYIVFALSDGLPTPRKEYLRVLSILGSASNIPKASRTWFYDIYGKIKDSAKVTESERNLLAGIAVGAYFMDYEYEKADEIASVLCVSEDIPWQASCNLAEFYTTTRRYDSADEVIEDALKKYSADDSIVQTLIKCKNKNTKQREKANAGKQEYLPNPKENRDAVRKKYIDFLASIGIEANTFLSSINNRKPKNVIPQGQYPSPVETRDTDFESFVAFDLETTGRSSKIDSIIEIGAVKVVNGNVIDSAEFTFQELVRPLDHKKVSAEISEITGITNEKVYSARPIWEVLPDFIDFAGDSVLLGFNCMAFDSRFMVRAGRYSNLIITNRYFDVMRYANQVKELGIETKKITLNALSEKLGIENPSAHRALADALTTAKVFLKLKEIEAGTQPVSVENLLADLEDW